MADMAGNPKSRCNHYCISVSDDKLKTGKKAFFSIISTDNHFYCRTETPVLMRRLIALRVAGVSRMKKRYTAS